HVFCGDGAVSPAWKAHCLWEPSQKGLFFDWPQRHRAMLSLPAGVGDGFPRWSTMRMVAGRSRGPCSRQRMVMGSLMLAPDYLGARGACKGALAHAAGSFRRGRGGVS